MGQEKLLSRRQPDGAYRVHVSDGAEHHLLGTVRRASTLGVRGGRHVVWRLEPAPGLTPKRPEGDTLGDARAALLAAWQETRSRITHGMPGVLVVVEGEDGAGKTWLARELVAAFAKMEREATLIRNPSSGPVGKHVRALAERGEVLPAWESTLLFAADRAQAVREGILPALAAGHVVVSDRYVLSSLAYQGPSAGMEWVASVNAHMPPPDVVLFLDVPQAVGRGRLEARGAPLTTFESEDVRRELTANYGRAIAHLERQGTPVIRVDASGSRDEVRAAALAALHRFVPALRAE